MSPTTQVIFGLLVAVGYVGLPVVLIWGWVRWIRLAKQTPVPAILSLAAFVLASLSAMLAVSSISHAHVTHGFQFYDPRLMKIFRWGFLLSFGVIIFGLFGMWRPSSLRWHALAAGIGMLAFWVIAVEGE